MALNSTATAPTSTRPEEGSEATMTDRSLINDPSDFVPTPPKKLGKWAKWFEGGEPLLSLVSEAIVDYSVDFVVRETAEQRARRIWRMEKEPQDVD
jgi:hypothetical protein